jgi:hypothetical protein
MHYIFESFFVGVYLLIWFKIIELFIPNFFYLSLFTAGFCKHFFSYFLGLHDYYCKCFGKKNQNIFITSLIEGVVVLLFGLILNNTTMQNINIFMIGVLMHIIAEKIGIHSYFCQTYC